MKMLRTKTSSNRQTHGMTLSKKNTADPEMTEHTVFEETVFSL